MPTLQAIQADITSLTVDAIVNAANESNYSRNADRWGGAIQGKQKSLPVSG